MAFEDHLSGKRMPELLGERLGRYRLRLHPTKTRFVDFRFKRPNGRHPATVGTTFNFLGFTHVWGQSRKGKNVVRQITAKDRYARALASVAEWCRRNLHCSFRDQHAQLLAREALRPTAKTASLQRLHHLPQSVDLGFRPYALAVEGRRKLADHAMQRYDVVRQGREIDRHTRSLSPRAQTAENYGDDESIGRSLTPPRQAATDVRASANRYLRAGPRVARR
jgi:hypothetical protein